MKNKLGLRRHAPDCNPQKSKLARRLVRIFALLVIVPLVCTTIVMSAISRRLSLNLVSSMKKVNRQAIRDSAQDFQQMGREAIRQSGSQNRQISMQALESTVHQTSQTQANALNAASSDLSGLTRRSFDGAMRQSLQTHHATLQSVREEMARLFAQSAQDTQQQATGSTESAMLALVNTLMQERAERLAASVSDHIANATKFLVLTAQTPDLQEGKIAGQKATLDALARRFPQFQLLAVMDKTGRESAMSASDHAVTPDDLGTYPAAAYFRAALSGKSYVGVDPDRSAAGAPILRLAVPIEAYRGKVVGVLSARLLLDELWDTIRATRIGKQGFAYVRDGNGKPLLPPRAPADAMLVSACAIEPLGWRILAAVPRREALLPIEVLKATVARNSRHAQAAMQAKMDRSAQIAAQRLQSESRRLRDANTRQMQATARQVVVRLRGSTETQARHALKTMETSLARQTEAMQKTSERRMTRAVQAAPQRLIDRIRETTKKETARTDRAMVLLALAIALTCCLLGSLLALFTAGRIVRPIVQLAQLTQAIANGDLTRRADERAPDEIGDLAAAFNAMAASLQKSHDELNEAEAQLVQSAKLASLGTLSAGVAHELNQPVAIVRGIAQQLQGEPGLSADCLEDLKLIEGQTTRMTKIIKHLRTFCRTGGAESARVEVDRVVQDCFILIGEQLRAHNVGVALELSASDGESGYGSCVLADANELEQVFINLITNARDALEDQASAQITIRSRTEGRQYIVEFRDNGAGVPESVAAQIFDPFFTTKEPGKGTGLGLSISHSILKKHGGAIRVENDGGAVFTITLPLAPAEAGETALPVVSALPKAA